MLVPGGDSPGKAEMKGGHLKGKAGLKGTRILNGGRLLGGQVDIHCLVQDLSWMGVKQVPETY